MALQEGRTAENVAEVVASSLGKLNPAEGRLLVSTILDRSPLLQTMGKDELLQKLTEVFDAGDVCTLFYWIYRSELTSSCRYTASGA
jgi:hypothetical protein